MTLFNENIKMAFGALAANKLRAFLTALGVIVGITIVLIMGTALSGLDNALEQTLSIFGEDILYVDRFSWAGDVDWVEQRNRKRLDYKQYQEARKLLLKSAEYVVPSIDRGARSIRYGDVQMSGTEVTGTTYEYIQMLGGNIQQGRFFNELEDQAGSPVVVLGFGTAEALFEGGDPIGKSIDINGLPFTVIGVMPKRGTMLADFVDNTLYIPIKRFFGLFSRRTNVTIQVKAGGLERMEDMMFETTGIMRQIRSIAPGAPDDFGVNTQSAFREQTDILRYSVWGIGLFMTGLSFLVGCIGIMNIMFVSVTERTKEIGIRKALGATKASILFQFLVEAITLCMAGAAIGLALTSALVFTAVSIFDELSFISPTIPLAQVLVAIIVAVIVGIIAGIIPAFLAARLDPVEALRAD